MFRTPTAPQKGPARSGQTPSVQTAADVLVAVKAVIEAVRCGDLTPDEGARLMSVIEQARKTIESVEFEARLCAIEERVDTEKPGRRINNGQLCK